MALYLVNPSSVVSSGDVNQLVNLLTGNTTTVGVTVSNRIRAASTGAASGSGGYSGQVAGAAPASGSFVAGDFVSDGTLGAGWVCSGSGSPGTWGALAVQISTNRLGGTTASVTFSGIPAFNHVEARWQARTTSGNLSDSCLLRLNGDSGSNYGSQQVIGQSTTASATQTNVNSGTSITVGVCAGGTATAGYYGGGCFDIPNWGGAASGHQATVVGTSFIAATTAASGEIAGTYGGAYNPSASLTSLTFLPAAGSFAAGSTFSLYGYM